MSNRKQNITTHAKKAVKYDPHSIGKNIRTIDHLDVGISRKGLSIINILKINILNILKMKRMDA